MTSQIVQDFKEGLGDGKLLIQRCNDCSHLALYPRYSCVACQSENLGWIPAEGSGVLHSFTVLRAGAPEGFEQDLPYALAPGSTTNAMTALCFHSRRPLKMESCNTPCSPRPGLTRHNDHEYIYISE